MTQELLLVGSIPLETAEEVFRVFGWALGGWLPYIPDGEIGERQYWIDGLAYRVLNGHPELETIRRPAPDENGIEQWRPRGLHDQFQFRVRPGIVKVRFGDPGWRLGYTRDAISSYYIFSQLKKEGVLPAHLRLQVCLPLTYSAVTSFFPDPTDHPRIVPGFYRSTRFRSAEDGGQDSALGACDPMGPRGREPLPRDQIGERWIGGGGKGGRAPHGAEPGDLAPHTP